MIADSGTLSHFTRRLCVVVAAAVLAALLLVFLPASSSAQQDTPSTVHVVKAGETLSEIAEKYGVSAADILELNGIDDANAIIEGQKLRIPLTAMDAAEPAPPGMHRIQPGETLSAIAKRYGVGIDVMMEINGIDNPDAVYSGQLLAIPVGDTSAPASGATPVIAASGEGTVTASIPLPSPPESTTVQVGETLSGIAKRYGLGVEELKALNGIDDANAIYSGQVLRLIAATPTPVVDATPVVLPEDGAVADAATAVVAPPAPIVRSGSPIASLNQTYTVRSGDFLNRIALRLGIDPGALLRINGFADLGEPLATGQKLLLPATGDELRPRTAAQEYVVQPGESLGAIAQRFTLAIGDILTANRIADPNAIYPGQRLIIPARSLTAAGGSRNQIGPERSGYYYYTVQPGNTLSAIAKQFGSTMQAIQAYNGLPDIETVYTGMEIKIPYGAPDLGLVRPPVPFSGTRFIVSLSRQQCWVYQGDRVKYAWNCSTGAGERKTKAGNYAVQSKIANAKSNAYRLDMPYWLGIYDVGKYENGIHGLPVDWGTGKKIWTTLIGQPATFGCAMLGDLDAATLFRMAFLGMPVHVVN